MDHRPVDGGTGEPRLFGFLCTFQRPTTAVHHLQALAAQTRPPDVLVVVDNGGSEVLGDAIAATETPMEVRYVAASENLGPAGGFHLALASIRDEAGAGDFIVHLDDDDPPVDDRQLADLVAELSKAEPRVAGVGLSGGRLRERSGVIAPVAGTEDLEPVDHLHGGYLPVYRASAMFDVDGTDPTYFYGFEELELGRRMRARGWRLLVANRLMREVVHLYPKRAHAALNLTRIDDHDLGWSRFHKERNLLRILRREHLWAAVGTTVVGRHLARPLLALPRQPAAAVRRIQLGLRACVSALRDEGGIDHRYPPSGRS